MIQKTLINPAPKKRLWIPIIIGIAIIGGIISIARISSATQHQVVHAANASQSHTDHAG